DAELLGVPEIEEHARALSVEAEDEPRGQTDLLATVDAEKLGRQVNQRLVALRDHLEAGTYVGSGGKPLSGDDLAVFAPWDGAISPELRVTLDAVTLRCGPLEEAFYAKDLELDRNSCSTIAPQEVLQVLARWPNGMRLARTRYVLGWISA